MDQDKLTEMLIKSDAKLSEICRSTKRIEKRLEKSEDRLDNHIGEAQKLYVPWRHFLWVTALLISLIGGAYTYTTRVDDYTHQHVEQELYYQIEETP